MTRGGAMRGILAHVGRIAVVTGLAGGVAFAQQPAETSISAADLSSGLKDPQRWLHYSGDYSSQRHSPLTQVTPENVGRLAPQWVFQTETLGKFEATPIVLDGVIYVTGPL